MGLTAITTWLLKLPNSVKQCKIYERKLHCNSAVSEMMFIDFHCLNELRMLVHSYSLYVTTLLFSDNDHITKSLELQLTFSDSNINNGICLM